MPRCPDDGPSPSPLPLISRATLRITSALDITGAVNPPRAAFLDYPLGHTTAKPHQPELQRRILPEALGAFESLTAPATVKMLPFEWSADQA